MCGRCVGPTTLPPSVSRLSRQCEILYISQPYRPPKPVTGIALLLVRRLTKAIEVKVTGVMFQVS
jgi:hypothetical protein